MTTFATETGPDPAAKNDAGARMVTEQTRTFSPPRSPS
jgi:hypothetical protein